MKSVAKVCGRCVVVWTWKGDSRVVTVLNLLTVDDQLKLTVDVEKLTGQVDGLEAMMLWGIKE